MQVRLVDGSALGGVWQGRWRQGREGEARSGTMSSGQLKHWALERVIRPERRVEARLRDSDFHGGAGVPQEAVSRGEARSPLGAEGAPGLQGGVEMGQERG